VLAQESGPPQTKTEEADLFRHGSENEDGQKVTVLLTVLEKRKKELDEREEALQREEERLKFVRRDLEEMLAQSIKIREDLEKMKAEAKETEGALDLLIKVYETMPPEEAALRIAKMNERVVLRLLTRMKGKAVANILSFVEPTQAARLSEKLAAQKRVVQNK
jgi:flagellar motility protein MotE (MotC chaperone)